MSRSERQGEEANDSSRTQRVETTIGSSSSVEALPLALDHFSVRRAAIHQRICRRWRDAEIALGEQSYKLRLGTRTRPATGVAVEFAWGSETLILIVERNLIFHVLGRLVPEEAWESFDGETRSLLLEYVLAPGLDHLEVMTARRLQVRTVTDSLPTASHEQSLGLSVTPSDGMAFSTVLCANDDQLERTSEMLETHLGRARDPWPALPVSVICRLATLKMTSGELKQIKAGDLLLAPNMSPDGLVEMIVGADLAISGRRDGAMVTVVEKGLRSMIQQEQEETMEDATLTDPDQVTVNVTFELGRIECPLGELTSIDEGYIFNIGKDLSAPIDLRVGGQLIGRGNLVQIEDRIGVRISELFRHD